MWEYVLGGATIFGLIVTLGAWINGQLTRKMIRELSAQHQTMIEILQRMDAKLDLLLERQSRRKSGS